MVIFHSYVAICGYLTNVPSRFWGHDRGWWCGQPSNAAPVKIQFLTGKMMVLIDTSILWYIMIYIYRCTWYNPLDFLASFFQTHPSPICQTVIFFKNPLQPLLRAACYHFACSHPKVQSLHHQLMSLRWLFLFHLPKFRDPIFRHTHMDRKFWIEVDLVKCSD